MGFFGGEKGPLRGPGSEGSKGSQGSEGGGFAAFGGDEYKISVTEFPFVSPLLHDEVPKPSSFGRRWRRRRRMIADFRRKSEAPPGPNVSKRHSCVILDLSSALSGSSFLRKEPTLRACLPTLRVIRGRSADNRKALLNSRCPLRGHRVYEVKNDNIAPFLLYAGPTSADLETLCRVSTKRRISGRIVSEGMPVNTRLREGAAIWRPAIRRLSYWRLTGFRQNDSGAGSTGAICFPFP